MKRFLFFPEPEGPVPLHENLRLALGVTGLIIILLAVVFLLQLRGQRAEVAAAPTQEVPAIVAAATATAEPATPTTVASATPSPSPTAVPTETTVPTETPTAPPTSTSTPSPTPTAVPTETPTPTATPPPVPEQVIATCIEPAALFAGPGVRFAQTGIFIEIEEQVEVTGVSENGFWMVVEKDGASGWATVSFFDVSAEALATLPLVTEVVAELPPAPGGSGDLPPTAYWNETVSSKKSIGERQWTVDLSIRVPLTGTYQFRMEGRAVSWLFDREVENGYALYVVTLSGMSCDAPLIGELTVLRNGEALEVRNEFNNEPGAIFVSAPEC